MKKCVNGALVEMTPEEIAEWEQSIADAPAPEPTTEEPGFAIIDPAPEG